MQKMIEVKKAFHTGDLSNASCPFVIYATYLSFPKKAHCTESLALSTLTLFPFFFSKGKTRSKHHGVEIQLYEREVKTMQENISKFFSHPNTNPFVTSAKMHKEKCKDGKII